MTLTDWVGSVERRLLVSGTLVQVDLSDGGAAGHWQEGAVPGNPEVKETCDSPVVWFERHDHVEPLTHPARHLALVSTDIDSHAAFASPCKFQQRSQKEFFYHATLSRNSLTSPADRHTVDGQP